MPSLPLGAERKRRVCFGTERREKIVDTEKRAQFVRGVIRRTKSDIPPDWAPGWIARFAAMLAVYLHALAACWAFFLLRILLLQEMAVIEPWPLWITLLTYIMSLLFGYFGRRILELGIPFVRLVWFVSFGLLAYCFGEYACSPGVSSPGLMIAVAIVFFLIGFGPALAAAFLAKGQRKRGYDDGTMRQRSRVVLICELLAMALGVYSAVVWFPSLAS